MQNYAPTITFVIPSYNAATYLPLLCRSLQAQTMDDFEVLIGDDGSTDDTTKVLKEFASDIRFRYYRWSNNRGFNQTFFWLLQMIRTEFWCSPGADDILYPDFALQRIRKLKARPEAGILHGRANLIDENGEPIIGLEGLEKELSIPELLPASRALCVLLQHNIINQPSAVIRTQLTRLILPYFARDFRYAADWYLWILHVSCGFDLMYDDAILHDYRVHSESLSVSAKYSAIRDADIRLAPLCALSQARDFSTIARKIWGRYGKALYALWLRRSLKLMIAGNLTKEWVEEGRHAQHGANANGRCLNGELVANSLSILQAALAEKAAQKHQRFRVSGLAQVNDTLFR